MSVSVRVQRNSSIGGKSFGQSVTIEGDSLVQLDKDVPAAKAGTLTTRTDANTGTITGLTGHGVTTGARLDMYWAGGARRGITVGTVSGNSIPIDLGSGTDLPSTSTPVTFMVPQEEAFSIDGDDTMLLAFFAGAKATIVMANVSNVEQYSRVFGAQNADFWTNEDGDTNPVEGDTIVKCFVSHGDSTSAQPIRVAAMVGAL